MSLLRTSRISASFEKLADIGVGQTLGAVSGLGRSAITGMKSLPAIATHIHEHPKRYMLGAASLIPVIEAPSVWRSAGEGLSEGNFQARMAGYAEYGLPKL